jgi:hypothetical protein
MSLALTRRLRGGVEVGLYLHSFLLLALDRGEWPKSHPGFLTAMKNPGNIQTGRGGGPRAGLDGFLTTK